MRISGLLLLPLLVVLWAGQATYAQAISGVQIYSDVKPSGVSSGTSNGSMWQTRALNVAESGNLDGVSTSLASNAMTLVEGLYVMECGAPASLIAVTGAQFQRLRIYDVTGDAVVQVSPTAHGTVTYTTVSAFLHVTGTPQKSYTLQQYVSGPNVETANLGWSAGIADTPEVYASCRVTRFA